MADTGLPGSPNAYWSSRTPNQNGLPGLSRTRHRSSSKPSSSRAGFTWSCGPTETPPEMQRTSACASASVSDATVAAWSSPALRRSTSSAPARRASAPIATAFESWIWPGPSGCPAGTSSSPVATMASRGRFAHEAWASPSAASIPSSAGPRSAPARSTRAPRWRSSPARRTFAPGCVSGTSTSSPVVVTRSIGTTASAPRGITAPVEMRTAAPGWSSPSNGCPACDSPTTGSRPPGPATTAKPSMADESNGGSSKSLTTSSARTRPSASSTETVSCPSGRTAASTRARASSTETSWPGMSRRVLLDQASADADRDSLCARVRAELREDALRVRSHRLGGQPELDCDRLRLHAVGKHLEDLALALGQRLVTVVEHDRRGERGVDVEVAVARCLDRPDEVLTRRVLAHVTLHTGLQRVGQQARATVGGEDHDRRAELRGQRGQDRLDVAPRAPRVDDRHIRLLRSHAVERCLQARRIGHFGAVETAFQ